MKFRSHLGNLFREGFNRLVKFLWRFFTGIFQRPVAVVLRIRKKPVFNFLPARTARVFLLTLMPATQRLALLGKNDFDLLSRTRLASR